MPKKKGLVFLANFCHLGNHFSKSPLAREASMPAPQWPRRSSRPNVLLPEVCAAPQGFTGASNVVNVYCSPLNYKGQQLLKIILYIVIITQ